VPTASLMDGVAARVSVAGEDATLIVRLAPGKRLEP
jgi:hypothetical protein